MAWRKLREPPPLRDPPKFLPARLAGSDRYSLPPQDPSMAGHVDPRVPIKVKPQEVGLSSFERQAKEGLSFMKALGLVGAEASGSGSGSGKAPPPPAVQIPLAGQGGGGRKRLGVQRPKLSWDEEQQAKKQKKKG